ncbi:MAG: hydantoinase B/oxoprolinase family protein [Deltaproteobacteria bacterium]|nr:hydantoinase B/oxoprolinase family protein [Deltaproteobacteria bacterium]
MYKIGIDTGGTHTDLIMADVDTGETFSTKVSTTPDLVSGIDEGIDKLLAIAGQDPSRIGELVYGTTIVVNMIAQRQLGNTALITTRGFRDVLEIGRAFRETNIYDIQMVKPECLIQRHLRYEVTERIDFRGQVVTSLDLDEVRRMAEDLRRRQVSAVAICFLHAYTNPEHERVVQKILREIYPELFVSLSSEVNPQFREYERTSTTAINAAMMPAMITHLQEFESMMGNKQMAPAAFVMQANAGVASFEALAQKPVAAANSGPIAGIISSNELARTLGIANLVTFDMGGTSTDVSLIRNNTIKYTSDSRVEGYPISIPAVDLSFIGAGGGSIAWIDPGKALRVGPMSQGAYPGPVCYCRGGDRPTVTDANLVTGRIRPETFLQDLTAAVPLSIDAISRQIGAPLDMDVMEAAEGILQVVNSNMIRAIRNVSVEKGYDPREFTLIAYGGSGPLHAARLAEELEIPKVIVPFSPGTFSAQGLLMSDSKYDFVASRLISQTKLNPSELNEIFESLEEQANRQLDREGVDVGQRILVRSCDIRYYGQSFELNIPMPSGPIDENTLEHIAADYHETHRRIYGHAMREPLEYVNHRVSAIGPLRKFAYLKQRRWETRPQTVRDVSAEVFFDGSKHTVPVMDRASLACGHRMEGPAIVCEMGSTTIVYPGQTVEVDAFMNLVITTHASKARGGNQMKSAILLEVMKNALRSVADQMSEVMVRSSYSTIVKEMRDCSSSLFDAKGRLLAEGANIPIHLNCLEPVLDIVLTHYFPRETLQPGDIIITNHPYAGGKSLGPHHTKDMVAVAPIFHKGDRLVGFAVTMLHHNDIGGAWTHDGWTIDVWQEGILIEPARLYRGGKLDETLMKVLQTNNRSPRNLRGDLMAQVSGCKAGENGFLQIIDKYGPLEVEEAVESLLDYSERFVRSEIEKIPDGVYEAHHQILDDGYRGGPYRLQVRVTVAGSEIHFDYTGTDPQVKGPVNSPLSATISATYYVLKCLLDPEIHTNAGCYRPARITAPEGTLVNCTFPTACYERMVTDHAIVDLVMGAMAEAIPDRVMAESCGCLYNFASARNSDTHPREGEADHNSGWGEVVPGGLGARAEKDGISVMSCNVTNCALPPIEAQEIEAPVLFIERAIEPDSAGAGRFRGGFAQRTRWRTLGTETQFSFLSQKSRIPPQGLFGGKPGRCSEWIINEGRTGERRLTHAMGDPLFLNYGDTVTFITPGGGGYGDPYQRDPQAIRQDIQNGLVSPEAALSDYGFQDKCES